MDEPAKADPLSRARTLGAAVEAAADEIERRRRLVPEVVDAIHRLRLARMFTPRNAGGDEVAPTDAIAAIEEVSRHDLSVGWNLFVANAAALIAPYLPPETAREVFGSPRALVAWGPPNDCVLETAPGGFRVNGRWAFASGCRHATWMGAHGHVAEPDGGKRRDANGDPIVLTVLFPAGKAVLLDDWNTIGMRGTGSESYRVDDLFVPEFRSGRRGDPSLRREPGPLYAFTMQSLYAAGVAGVALGAARAMLDALIDLAARKTPRGLRRLADRPAAQADGSAGGSATRGGARLSHGHAGDGSRARRCGRRHRHSRPRPGAPRRHPRDPRRRSGRPAAPGPTREWTRSSPAALSSAGSATCTRCRNRSRRARRITSVSAGCCSATRRRISCNPPARERRTANGSPL